MMTTRAVSGVLMRTEVSCAFRSAARTLFHQEKVPEAAAMTDAERPPPDSSAGFAPPHARPAAALLQEPHGADGHAALDPLHHVVDRERGRAGADHRLHLDAGAI